MGVQDGEEGAMIRDENDLPDEELTQMWEEGEPVELVDAPYTINASPWEATVGGTSAHAGMTIKSVILSYFGSYPSSRPEYKESSSATRA